MGVRMLLAVLCASAGLGRGPLLAAEGCPSWSPPAGAVQHAARPAKGRFLVASRNLGDPNFSESVVLLLSHGPSGSMGVIVNRPTDLPLAPLLPELPELRDRSDRVSFGGPVGVNAMTMLVRARRQPTKSEAIFGDVYASGNLDSLRDALAPRGEIIAVRAYVGYAGWGAGQLEHEIARGDWYVGPADAASVFDTAPTELWTTLLDRFSGVWTKKQAPRRHLDWEIGQLALAR